jgi:hypothetical protein
MTTKRRAQAARLYVTLKSLRRVGDRMGISHVAVRNLLIGASVDVSYAIGCDPDHPVDVARLARSIPIAEDRSEDTIEDILEDTLPSRPRVSPTPGGL